MTDGALSPDDVFEILSNARRRQLLFYLTNEDGQAELYDLSRQIASDETGLHPEELERRDFKRVYVSLYQTHIPLLEDHGLITYRTDDRIITLTDKVTQLYPHIQTEPGNRQVWLTITAAVAGFGLLSILGLWMEVNVVEAVISTTSLATLVTGLLIAITLGQYIDERRHSARLERTFAQLVGEE